VNRRSFLKSLLSLAAGAAALLAFGGRKYGGAPYGASGPGRPVTPPPGWTDRKIGYCHAGPTFVYARYDLAKSDSFEIASIWRGGKLLWKSGDPPMDLSGTVVFRQP